MSATHARLAKQYHAGLANVGDVFEKYRALYPGETMYANDGEHASPLTSNIAAYVILRTITGNKPVCVSAEEKKIEAAYNAFLSGIKKKKCGYEKRSAIWASTHSRKCSRFSF